MKSLYELCLDKYELNKNPDLPINIIDDKIERDRKLQFKQKHKWLDDNFIRKHIHTGHGYELYLIQNGNKVCLSLDLAYRVNFFLTIFDKNDEIILDKYELNE
jgi:hypothetical protein